ncbi:MAG: HAAS signaling domain-containing protein [Actinomycetota bacterium]
MNTQQTRIVDNYKSVLRRSLQGLPESRRNEIQRDIEEHIDQAVREAEPLDDAELRTLLERIGDPDDIAAGAAEEGRGTVKTVPILEIFALIFLLLGGILLPFVGWFAGLVLLWASKRWTFSDKVVGTLIVPGGLAVPFWLAFMLRYDDCPNCPGDPPTLGSGPFGTLVRRFFPTIHFGMGILRVLFLIIVLATLLATFYLSLRLRRRSATTDAG